ncbi:cyclic nucleotide-binding domain-containing protein [Planctomycetaceae bacterium]|jgi:Fe-S-cluster-containing dehydrogenase component/CRP-like cAMP-binding protein|nr:cyclic nucleotide-binding domain-containing protein [bacterium]MDC0262312.1 cyclic nucleotide-binding domain-containing protein [Planctomycetaceae bacterium]MDG2391323.1 cyclic nucleotide-binding domain-containing protein [Planctomycetaceae bacterium]
MSNVQIKRPERWSVPFSESMTDEDVEHVLQMSLFSEGMIDPDQFGQRISLAGILKNDASLLKCQEGEIIIRKGEWGNSAFFLLSGSVNVVAQHGDDSLPAEILGRSNVRQKSFLDIIRQVWNGHRQVESRNLEKYSSESPSSRSTEQGTRVYLQDFSIALDLEKTATINAVDFFGEQSALGRIERTATVIAAGDCELLEIRWQGIRDMMSKAPWLKLQIESRFRMYGLQRFLQASPYFEHLLPNEDREPEEIERRNSLFQNVLDDAEFRSYGSYDKVERFTELVESGTASNLVHEPLIAKEGEYLEGVYLIRSGVARVSHQAGHKHRTVSYLTPGQAFGVNEMIEGWKTGQDADLKYSLRAVGYVNVIFIPIQNFEQAVLNELMVRDQSLSTLPDHLASKPDDEIGQIDSGLLEFLVERRFVNGTATMVIDLDRCTRCDDCVKACATTHDNNPRFLRHGPIYDKYMVANACMHCADPVCMIQCPTGAIHRNLHGGEVVINDTTCIGCSACANNCPYDAIRMVHIRDEQGDLIFPTASESDVSAPLSLTPITKATKCDLCAEQITGPACQQACPHDALVRLNLGTSETAAEWFNR